MKLDTHHVVKKQKHEARCVHRLHQYMIVNVLFKNIEKGCDETHRILQFVNIHIYTFK